MPMMDHEEFLNQKHQVLDGSQGHASLNTGHYSWPSSTGQVSVSWNSYPKDNSPIENGTPASSAYYYDPQKITVSGDAQGEISTASHASTSSSLGEANITQGYAGYTDFSGYHTAGFQNYYYGYQQPAIDSSSQQVVASQNSGAPYQPLSSFQNAGSYASPTSYSGTHYNTGDHQTTAGYNYSNQTNIWNDANSGSYPLHHYSSYTSAETNSTPTTSSVATNPLHYQQQQQQQQQQYNQWSFYNPSTPIVSCAPGTENTYATTASATACPVQNVSGSYPYPSNQPPPPGTTSWGRDSGSSGVPSLQVTEDVMTYNRKNGWEGGAPGYQNNQMPLYFQKSFDSASPHKNCEDQQKPLYFHAPSSQYPTPPIFSTNQVSEKFQTPLQTVTTVDTRRVSKMQIPTNPRIASNLALGVPKTDKESSTTNSAMKPAYVSVSVPKLTNELSSHVDEAMIKGTFPTSLRAYVERTFARCKDDAQRAANQNKMKEMITKASADGSLFTRNWDVEPLFSLPNISDMGDQINVQSSVTVSSLPKCRRSPNRRTKSRWEPIAEDTLVEKLESATNSSAKDLSWDNLKTTEKAVDSSKFVNKDSYWNGGVKFVLSHHQTPTSKIAQRSVKKQRFADSSVVMGNGDASSDSDKDQSLTKYYASAIALADTPDEKKRREHRSKRFDKGHENQTQVKHIRAKSAGSENTYIRRASAVVLTKNSEDSCSRAVEDIDWDAHTVKGTSQEVEKRYLRLTSAPDPATVRPEEVLEKALHVVQTSSKNYLYKCDQLKSIRQDLTVQRIQNELTVKVYETHARLALESGDLPEYNQCQSQLNSLYAEGIKGAHMEFSAYNLLCVILHSNNYRELLSSMARLSDEAKENDAVKHALAVRSAVSSGNYILFFRLYKSAPNLNTCLMDLYVERIRFEAVKCMSKSYRPSVPVTYIARILSFSSAAPREDGRDVDGLEECKEWLRAHGGTLTVDNNGELQLDTKVSSSSLYMPDPEDAVAHGDTSLAVNDFLTRAL